ncbi:helix-turn-helix transcriptional regulator [Enterobacter kobei]|uniref:helix-turn-helix transcriptional regulator n=1 Tax=Enterobacter kobei TaxID=208224 RepID=UPI003CEDC5E3
MEKSNVIEIFEKIIETLNGTIAASHEVVLHDLARPERSVVRIINGHVSNRDADAPLLAGPDDDQGFIGLLSKPDDGSQFKIVKNYEATTKTGKVLKSASLIYYNEEGKPAAAFCMNVDTEGQELLKRLAMFITPGDSGPLTPLEERTAMQFSASTSGIINSIINKYRKPYSKLTKDQRRVIISEINARGIFKLKGGLVMAAKALGVTRFTVYNDLEALGLK